MKRPASKSDPANKARAGFSDPAVAAVFSAYPNPLQARLLALRRLILDTAKATEGVGMLEEALKWGQPSYLTSETKSGSTILLLPMKIRADISTAAIGTAGSPATVAAPTQSLWQTACIGMRTMIDCDWLLRRTGAVAVVNGVTW